MQVARKTTNTMRQETKAKRKVFREKNKYPKVDLICSICGREETLRVSRLEVYTEEVKKKYICILCPNPNSRWAKKHKRKDIRPEDSINASLTPEEKVDD